MCIHPCFECFLAVFLKSVGCHGHNGNVCLFIAAQCTDLPGGGVSVHFGHLNIHQDQIILILRSFVHSGHGIRAVLNGVHFQSGFLQNGRCNLSVQFVILDQQHLFARIVAVLGQKGLPARHHFVCQCIAQFRHKQRFGNKRRDTGLPGLVLNVGPIVGRQYDDRRAGFDYFTDPAHRLNAVHVRHQPVNNVNLELRTLIVRLHRAQDGFLAGGRPVGFHLNFPQHFAYAHAGLCIIIHNQCTGAFQARNRRIFHRFRTNLAVQGDRKLAALSLLALDGDGSAHHIYDVFRDGHAKARTLNAASCRSLFT